MTGQVRTDEMWRYTRTIEVQHSHEILDEQWSVLVAVRPSKYQGWEIELADGCKLQCTVGEIEYTVRMLPNPEIDNWGK